MRFVIQTAPILPQEGHTRRYIGYFLPVTERAKPRAAYSF